VSQGVSPARTQTRDLYWKPWDAPGCEHAAVRLGARGALVDGVILLRRDHRALRLSATAAAKPWARRAAFTATKA
jgi:hypothetical protein